jgi:hypothetical protein
MLLRPLLAFHFDVLLPIYCVYCCAKTPELAAVYQAAIFMPTDAERPETCIALRFIRLTAKAATQIELDMKRALLHKILKDTEKGIKNNLHGPADVELDPFVVGHHRNVATVVVWLLLYVLHPEAVFRTEAVAALYSVLDHLGSSRGVLGGEDDEAGDAGAAAFVTAISAHEGPSLEAASSVLAADVVGLHLFWQTAGTVDDGESDGMSMMSETSRSFSGFEEEDPRASAAAWCNAAADAGSSSGSCFSGALAAGSFIGGRFGGGGGGSGGVLGGAGVLAQDGASGTLPPPSFASPPPSPPARRSSSPPPDAMTTETLGRQMPGRSALRRGGGIGQATYRREVQKIFDPGDASTPAAEDDSVGVDLSRLITAGARVVDVVMARLGHTSGHMRSAADVHQLVLALSKKLARSLFPSSGAVLCEMGNVMLGLMTQETRIFVFEMLLPWAQRMALLEPRGSPSQLSRTRQQELTAAGFCLAYPDDCLRPLLEITVTESITGLPPIVATFWKSLALSAPPLHDGLQPMNVPVVSAWLVNQALNLTTTREQFTCRSLGLFIKVLGVQSNEMRELKKALSKKFKGAAAKAQQKRLEELRERALSHESTMLTDVQRRRIKAAELMQQMSSLRREKATRATLQAEEEAKRRREELEATQQRAEEERRRLDEERKQIQAEEDAQKRREEAKRAACLQVTQASQASQASQAAPHAFGEGGLEMKLADGRPTGPERLKRLAKPPQILGIPELDLDLVVQRQRVRDRKRAVELAAAEKLAEYEDEQ